MALCVCVRAREPLQSSNSRFLSLQIKPAHWSAGRTQENQSYNYPDFLCHFKRRTAQNLTAVLVWGRVSVTVRISTNFVLIESTVPSILLADSRAQWQKCEAEEKHEQGRSIERTERKGEIKKKHNFVAECLVFRCVFAFSLWLNYNKDGNTDLSASLKAGCRRGDLFILFFFLFRMFSLLSFRKQGVQKESRNF